MAQASYLETDYVPPCSWHSYLHVLKAITKHYHLRISSSMKKFYPNLKHSNLFTHNFKSLKKAGCRVWRYHSTPPILILKLPSDLEISLLFKSRDLWDKDAIKFLHFFPRKRKGNLQFCWDSVNSSSRCPVRKVHRLNILPRTKPKDVFELRGSFLPNFESLVIVSQLCRTDTGFSINSFTQAKKHCSFGLF